jgi:hypothetical protein
MLYEIIIGYFFIRFTAELLLGGEEEEEKHRVIKCRCDMCSGIYILNK